MDNTEDYRDLLDTLSEVRRRGVENRFIWCKAADEFETTVSHRQGLLLGGAWSPHFLSDGGAGLDELPWIKRMWRTRVVVIEKAKDPFAEWLPLMEAIAKAGESLLLVTKEISTELLQVLIVNSLKATLSCCVIHLTDDAPVDVLGKTFSSPPQETERVPQAAEVWVRRTGTALFPAAGDSWRGRMNDLEVISVGGESYAHQLERVRYLVRAIQAPVRRF